MNMGKCLQVEGDFRIKIGLNRTLQCLAFIGARSNSMSHSLNSMHRRSLLCRSFDGSHWKTQHNAFYHNLTYKYRKELDF